MEHVFLMNQCHYNLFLTGIQTNKGKIDDKVAIKMEKVQIIYTWILCSVSVIMDMFRHMSKNTD